MKKEFTKKVVEDLKIIFLYAENTNCSCTTVNTCPITNTNCPC